MALGERYSPNRFGEEAKDIEDEDEFEDEYDWGTSARGGGSIRR
jgi:hypothetical protein